MQNPWQTNANIPQQSAAGSAAPRTSFAGQLAGPRTSPAGGNYAVRPQNPGMGGQPPQTGGPLPPQGGVPQPAGRTPGSMAQMQALQGAMAQRPQPQGQGGGIAQILAMLQQRQGAQPQGMPAAQPQGGGMPQGMGQMLMARLFGGGA